MPKKPNTIIFEIQLRDAILPIWRIVEIPMNTTLHQFHLYLQVAMGWTSFHLYEFIIEDTSYQYLFEELDDFDAENTSLITLKDLDIDIGYKFSYIYDFGDYWEHDIVVKAITFNQGTLLEAPCCSAGAMACPPEDIGGIKAYNQLVRILIERIPLSNYPEFKEFKNFDIYSTPGVKCFSFHQKMKDLRKSFLL